MKITTKTTGVAEINRTELLDMIKFWMINNKGLTVTKVQYPEGFDKIVAIVEGSVDQGAKPLGAPVKPPKETTTYKGTTHKWEGLYAAIGEILDEQRKRKKSFISYDDLLAELHEMEDNRGNKLFVKADGDRLPMAVLRHRLAPSQIVRQAKGQPNLRSVTNSKKDKGLKFG